MPTRKKSVKAVVNPVDPVNAEERVVDQAFEVQVRELIGGSRWAELRAAFVLHGSTLTRREESRGEVS